MLGPTRATHTHTQLPRTVNHCLVKTDIQRAGHQQPDWEITPTKFHRTHNKPISPIIVPLKISSQNRKIPSKFNKSSPKFPSKIQGKLKKKRTSRMKIGHFSQGATTSMPRMGHGFRLLHFIAQGVHLDGRLLESEEKQEKWLIG